jgi:predicted transcriptional regulator
LHKYGLTPSHALDLDDIYKPYLENDSLGFYISSFRFHCMYNPFRRRRKSQPETKSTESNFFIGSINLIGLEPRDYIVTQAAPKKRVFDVSDISGTILQSPSEVQQVLSGMVSKGILTCCDIQDETQQYQLTEDGRQLKKSLESLAAPLYSIYWPQ